MSFVPAHLAVPAVWSEVDAAALTAAHPDSVVVLDANRRPTTVLPIAEVVRDNAFPFPVHARAAVVTAPSAAARSVLAAGGVAVLDHWPSPPQSATGEAATRMQFVMDAVAGDGAPVLVGFGDDELALRPLDGLHPSAALEGFTAPPSWWALGVMCTGRVVESSTPHHGNGLRIVTAVTRGNHELGWIDHDDGTRHDRLGPSEGRVPDAIRRALGLPTPPPPHPTDALFAAWWLSELAAVSARSWRDAARRHSAVKLFAIDGTTVPPDLLVDAAAALGRVHGWDDLRAATVAGASTNDAVRPEVADWMDAGMFSRELLGTVGAVPELLAAVERRCSRDVARRAASVVGQLPVAYAA